jgi:hypothetical protein
MLLKSLPLVAMETKGNEIIIRKSVAISLASGIPCDISEMISRSLWVYLDNSHKIPLELNFLLQFLILENQFHP